MVTLDILESAATQDFRGILDTQESQVIVASVATVEVEYRVTLVILE